MACTIKHTDFQPTKGQFTCPNCGTGYIGIETFAAGVDRNCLLLHEEDAAYCLECGGSFYGRQLARAWARKYTGEEHG